MKSQGRHKASQFVRRLWFAVLIGMLLAPGCLTRHEPVSGDTTGTAVQTARVNGVELGYRMLGQGPPLLMIMGYAGTMETWDAHLLSALSKQRQVILYDHRGTGHSSTDNSELTLSQMASDAVALLKALKIKKADLMGWSMGSIIAQEIALAHPDQVGKVVLYATAVDAAKVKKALDDMAALSPEAFAAELFPGDWKARHPDIHERLPGPANISPEAIKRQYQAMIRWKGTRNRLSQIKNPVLILVGEEDRVTPLDQNLAAASLVPGAWTARFKGADHWLMYQAPEELGRVINFFISARQNLLKPDPIDRICP